MTEESSKPGPFEDLPEALVEEMLIKSEDVGNSVYKDFNKIKSAKEKLRKLLVDAANIDIDRNLGNPPAPTTCGVDGSYAIERLLSTDILAVAALAVEGLTPPSEERYWPKPRHLAYVSPIPHHSSTTMLARGLMMEYELSIASMAPHDIIFLDYSITTPLIYMNQALNRLEDIPDHEISKLIAENLKKSLSSYEEILRSPRSDKIFVGVPKYTSRKEIGNKISQDLKWDDKALLTFLLGEGEFTKPVNLEVPPEQEWHIRLPPSSENLKDLWKKVKEGLDNIHVVYYRPHKWLPAIRLEVSSSVAKNSNRLAVLLKGIEYQCASPGIMEPYPLYISDRMVKHLGRSLPAIRQATTQHMAMKSEVDVGDIYLAMHGYRTEGGQ